MPFLGEQTERELGGYPKEQWQGRDKEGEERSQVEKFPERPEVDWGEA